MNRIISLSHLSSKNSKNFDSVNVTEDSLGNVE